MLRRYWWALATILGCAQHPIQTAAIVPAQPLVVCFSPGNRQPPGLPGYTAWNRGDLKVQLVADTAAGLAVALDTAPVIEGAINLGKRVHTLDTTPLLGYRKSAIAWTWATADSIHIAIGYTGSHTSLWLNGARVTADTAIGRWGDGYWHSTSGTFVLTGLSSAGPGHLIPACS